MCLHHLFQCIVNIQTYSRTFLLRGWTTLLCSSTSSAESLRALLLSVPSLYTNAFRWAMSSGGRRGSSATPFCLVFIIGHRLHSTVEDRAFPDAMLISGFWNSSPQHITCVPSLFVFQSRLNTHLFTISYSSPWPWWCSRESHCACHFGHLSFMLLSYLWLWRVSYGRVHPIDYWLTCVTSRCQDRFVAHESNSESDVLVAKFPARSAGLSSVIWWTIRSYPAWMYWPCCRSYRNSFHSGRSNCHSR